ncbi:type I polyketide synthase [Kibdelosporangium aridum]|uniref:8-amino-7-oxononanoate synthase n=1 Tax=Kibdelosporangium aridum TaxID=2030 RepID=A0A1W2FEU1_KIBAR|nr:type I polyketide synthase [Kibdelosporangium aridum]SMD20427.1 8-amino-7-oxononanoate synthase [Kibdelosporangium aridum]
MNDIAIVGLACRFPGAANTDQYWQTILQTARQFRPVPPDRWRHELYYTPDESGDPLKAYTDQVSFLESVDQFDPLHYGIPPLRAEAMDPQHRLLVDLAREALQDAGWERRPFDRSRTGVFIGMSQSDYRDLLTTRLRARLLADGSLHAGHSDPGLCAAIEDAAARAFAPAQAFSLPGTLLNMGACAVSSAFRLGGPSFVIDAACSSALVALQEAVHHLRSGSCAAALVGGAFLNLTPDALLGFCLVGAVSAHGVCRPFDERADGFVLGEGGALAVLRPLDDAMRDGDRVYAVIKGVGMSNDAAAEGPLTPRVEGQLAALRAAYQDAGVHPETIELIEAHGTATTVGDRVEIEALRAARTENSGSGRAHCYLSSVKALIGHTLPAAGAAGLVKVALALHRATIPPQPETAPGSHLPLAEAGFQIPDQALAWNGPADHPRRAAVSAFGFGGTNVHVVLEEAPDRRVSRTARVWSAEIGAKPWLFVLSAGSLLLLAEHAAAVREKIATNPDLTPASVAYTLATRAPLSIRLTLVAATRDELIDRLGTAVVALRSGVSGDLGADIRVAAAPSEKDRPKVVFLYPGQGIQRVGMLGDLRRRFPPFHEAVARLEAGVNRGIGNSLTSLVWPAQLADQSAEPALTDTRICQPALGVLSIAMTSLLAGCGVDPDIVLGHSVGEFPAAVAAGALDAGDATDFLVHRGAAMADVGDTGLGGMLAVQATEEQFAELVTDIDWVWPGCFNQPGQIVASGTADALAQLAERCALTGVPAIPLRVSHAFHSPLVAKADARVAEQLARLPLHQPDRVFVSTVSGQVCVDPDELRSCWRRHCSSPVRFGAAIRVAAEGGNRVFVQAFGGNGLLAMARQSVPDPLAHHFVSLSGAEPDEGRTFLLGLGRLAALGIPVDLLPLFEEAERNLVTLPASPLATQPYTIRKAEPGLPARRCSQPEVGMSDVVQFLRDQLDVLRTATGVRGTAAAEVSPSPAVVPAVMAKPDQDIASQRPPGAGSPPIPVTADQDIRDRVFGAIAKISAYPYEYLRGDHAVVGDLGFDSIMLADLFAAFQQHWPELRADASDLHAVTTIDDFVQAIATRLGARTPGVAVQPSQEQVDPPAHRQEFGDGPEFTDISAFPEILRHQERFRLLTESGVANPYFLTHEGTARDLTQVAGKELICFSSYNYLGLSGHPAVGAAAKQAIDLYGTSVSAARLLSGDRPLHRELDMTLADLLKTDDALGLVSGHATNVTVIGHLFGPGDLIVHDALAHDSILQGCKLSGATRRPFPHNDIAALEELLTRIRSQFRRVLIVVEGVYSMDGDIPDLPELIRVKKKHGALLMIDEAHSIGVLGATGGGIGEYFGVDRADVDLWMGTLSKAFASCGGYIGGSHAVIDYLKYTLPGFVYSAGMTPANAAASLAAIRQMRAEPERLVRLHQRALLFHRLADQAGIDTGGSAGTPVIPCVVGDSLRCVRLANALFERGISVCPILYPAVDEELARLRFFITSEHTPEQITHTVAVLGEELDRLETGQVATTP